MFLSSRGKKLTQLISSPAFSYTRLNTFPSASFWLLSWGKLRLKLKLRLRKYKFLNIFGNSSSSTNSKNLLTYPLTLHHQKAMEAVENDTDAYRPLQNSPVLSVDNLPEEISNLRHTLFWTCLLVFVYTSIFIVGLIGNIMVICVLRKDRIRNATELFTLNLAVADISVVIFCVLPTLLSSIFVPWLLGSFMCKAVAFVQGVSVCASVYSLVAISLDRFLVIVFPIKWPRGLTKFQARIIIVCIWLLASAIISPWIIAFHVVPSGPMNEKFCLESWPESMDSQLFFLIGNILMCYGLPLTVIFISNVIIWLHLGKRKVPKDSASPDSIRRIHKRTRLSVLKILSIVTLIFLFSWLPLYGIFFRIKIGGPLTESLENVISIMMPFAQWLGASNCCCNPLLYTFLNQKFRDSFRSLITHPKRMSF